MTSHGYVAVVGPPCLNRFSRWASLDPINCDLAGALLGRIRWRLADLRLGDQA